MFFIKSERFPSSFAVLRPDWTKQPIDQALADCLADEMGAKNLTVSRSPDGNIDSITVPRNELRVCLRDHEDLRQLLRSCPVTIQEIKNRGFIFKRLRMSGAYSAPVYVRAVQFVGVDKSLDEDSGPSSDEPARFTASKLAALRDRMTDWGEIKIPAIVLTMTVGIILGIGWAIKNTAESIANDMAEDNKTMLRDDKGLAEIVRKKQGLEPASTTSAEVATAPATKPQSEATPPPAASARLKRQ